jgi:ABC-type transporter Mla maintaining outer membrane lipid asymmetry ATPase subunit MlaF
MSHPSPDPTGAAIEMREVTAVAMRDVNSIVARHVNWTLPAGGFCVIGGLQGAGKSDFLFMTGGLMPPAEGTYRLFGSEMPIFQDDRLGERLRLGLVFDGGQLFNHLTVGENIALPLRYHRNLTASEAAPDVQRMLELTELEPWADSTPGAIGRNWQKRVGLARALMLRPEVLLIDNPLAGLDLRHRAWWLGVLEQLSRGHSWMNGQPVTLIVTTDDLQPWRGEHRQFAVLKDKELVFLGSWERVEESVDAQVRELLAMPPHSI